jgi:acyl-CoA reductase-like NAD-dependent aldehyde dehydrogenase
VATLEVRSPFSGQPVGALPFDDAAALERKLAAAQAAFGQWRSVPVEERVRVVGAGVQWFRRNAETVAREVTLQMGKPLAQARSEVEGMLGRAEHMLAIAAQALAPEILPPKPGFTRRIEHAPLGVVLNLSAWNYPLLITVNVVVPALLAGNTVLLKHSARTPLCGRQFATAFGDRNLVADLVLTHAQTARLIGDPRIAHVAFTGSVEGGRQVFAATSQRFIDTGLELGGKDPAYVAADVDLETAVAGVVDGACYNAGQSCCAVERVYVHRSLYDAFLERAAALLAEYRLGDPLLETTTMGPLVSQGAVENLERQVADARAHGARVLFGGARREGTFFLPTLLADCRNDTLVMQEESFGPLVPVLAVRDDDEALAHMNDSRYGLTASVWTRDRARADRFAALLEAGTVYQNRCDYLDPALPWTGWKDSGKGSTLSRHGFLHLTRRKSVHFRE